MKILFTVVNLILACNFLYADTFTFTAASGDWNDTANWDNYPGTTIGAGDEAIIDGICTIPGSLNVRNEGTLTINAEAEIITTSGGPIFLNFIDAIMVIDGKLTVNNIAYNQGTLTLNGELQSNHVYINFNDFTNNGKLTTQGNQFSNSGHFTNNGEFITLTTMSNQDVFDQLGVYRGTDEFHLDDFENQGTLAPGASATAIGELEFFESYIENGTYEVDIAGDAGPGLEDGHDLLDVKLNTTINGNLIVQLQNGYIPNIGDEFKILECNTAISGTYGSVIYPSLPSGSTWEIEYNTFNITIKVIVGDPPVSTKTYYISNSSGNDSNSGLSPSSAWQTIGKMASILYESGDSVLLKRGDTWSGISQYFSRSFVYIGAYGNGTIPTITNIQELPNVSDDSNWSFINGLWECELSIAPTRLFLDDIEVLRASLLSEVGVADSEGMTPKWFHSSGKIFIDHSTNPATTWSEIKGSQNYITFNMEGSNMVTLSDISIEGATGPSLQLANCQNVIVNNCQLGKYASSGILLSYGSENCTVNNNIIDSDYTQMYGVGNSTDRGCRDGIRLANDASNNVIENNTIKNWSHNGIELLNTFVSSDGVNNNRIKYNHISAPDIPYAHPIGADGPLGRCTENEFGYNFIIDCKTTCQINGNKNRFHHNILKHFRQSPAKNTFSAHAITIAAYDVLGIGNVSHNNIFENNLIIDTDESAFRFDDQGFDILVDSIFVRNNIIIDSGLNPINDEYNLGTSIYFDDSEYMNDIFFENNLFYQSSILGDVLYKVISNEYIDLSDLNLLNEIDGIIAENNIKEDPLLEADDTPALESPAINSGDNNIVLNSENDYYGNPRIIGGKIDIGPIENQSSCTPNMVIFINHLAIGSENGRSWRNAYKTVYDALGTCPSSLHKEYWVAQGSYFPTASSDQTLSISLNDDSSLYGGFRGLEISRDQRDFVEYQTILSGNIGAINNDEDNSNEIISQSNQSNVLFDGIYVENAYSDIEQSAIMITNSSTNFSNLVIQNNESIKYAAFRCEGCTTQFYNVEIINNTTILDGVSKVSSTGNLEIIDSNIEGQLDVIGVLQIFGNTIFKE